MIREAKCSCGQLSIRVTGDPRIVLTCSCLKCQRRTGSAFGVSSYFANEQVGEISGHSRTYYPATESGMPSKRYFCPHCGDTVYWEAAFFPDQTGIPAGAFADPQFPEPMASVWCQSKHPWVEFPSHWLSSDAQDIDVAKLLSRPNGFN